LETLLVLAGNLGFCVGSVIGLNQTTLGKLRIYTRYSFIELDNYTCQRGWW